jgi:hypothetical protein
MLPTTSTDLQPSRSSGAQRGYLLAIATCFSSGAASAPTHLSVASGDCVSRFANSKAAALSPALRLPIARSAMFTAILDEIALIPRSALDQGEHLDERRIAGGLVVHRQAPQQREGAALVELIALVAPLGAYASSGGGVADAQDSWRSARPRTNSQRCREMP